MSDTTALEDGMTATKLSAHMLTKLNGTCAWPGEKSLILPVRSRTDVDIQASGPQKVSVEASDSKVSASFPKRRANRDLDLHSEVQIICNVGERTFGDAFWKPMMDNYDVIRDHIANVIPGFENYNERLKRPGGFMLPHAARERIFNTSDGKAQLTINETDTIELEGDQLLLTTVRSHDQYNTISYGLDDRYRGVRGGRRVIFIRKEDLIQRGLKDGDIVDVVSEYESGRTSVWSSTTSPRIAWASTSRSSSSWFRSSTWPRARRPRSPSHSWSTSSRPARTPTISKPATA